MTARLHTPELHPPPMSRSSSSSTITLVPSTPPPTKAPAFEWPCITPDHLSTDATPARKPCLDLSAVKITKPIKALLSSALRSLDRPLRIVGLLATADSGCHMYADMTARACKAAEVVFDKLDLSHAREQDDDTAFGRVRNEIERLNADDTVDGLIVYFPLFSAERDAQLRALISPRIDVEGVNPTSLQRSYAAAPGTVDDLTTNPADATVYPCTALAVVRALQASDVGVYNPDRAMGERFSGRTVTVINRSETVGRPLAAMLANDGARVYSVDIDSTHIYERDEAEATYRITPFSKGQQPTLAAVLADSDVVVSAVPGANFKVPTHALRPGAVCIDLSERGNYLPDVRERAGVYAPRLGSVTILMLKLNALVLRCNQRVVEVEDRGRLPATPVVVAAAA